MMELDVPYEKFFGYHWKVFHGLHGFWFSNETSVVVEEYCSVVNGLLILESVCLTKILHLSSLLIFFLPLMPEKNEILSFRFYHSCAVDSYVTCDQPYFHALLCLYSAHQLCFITRTMCECY